MKTIKILAIIMLLIMTGSIQLDAGTSEFQFPRIIKFKLLKSNRIMGSCTLVYVKDIQEEGLSLLKMTRFEGLGIKSDQWLATRIFKKDASIYADFVMKGNKALSEIRLEKNKQGFDGKVGNIFIHKDLESDSEMGTEIFTEHKVIDLLSMFFVTSQRVANGTKGAAKFNFLIDKSTKIVDMLPMRKEKAVYDGKEVEAHVFSYTYHNQELFRLRIYKDSDGYCFPVSVSIVTDFTGQSEPLELRTHKIKK